MLTRHGAFAQLYGTEFNFVPEGSECTCNIVADFLDKAVADGIGRGATVARYDQVPAGSAFAHAADLPRNTLAL